VTTGFSAAVVLLVVSATLANAETIAITGATVHTVGPAGTLENATVLLEDGVIKAVGTDIDVPTGTEQVDATGKIITPGLISPAGQLGLVEVGAVSGSVDSIQRGDRFSASFDVADAYNPRSTLIAVTRSEGVTRALITPRASLPDEQGNMSHVLSGLASVVQLGNNGAAIVTRGAVIVANLGETGSGLAAGSRAAALMILRSALDDALDYARNKAAYNRGDWREYSISATDLDALQGVVNGVRPLLVEVNRASDIEAVLRLAAEYDIQVIIIGGSEAWMLADALAAAQVPVILDAANNLPGDFDHINARLESGALLARAGVQIAFGGGTARQTHNARNITQAAGIAVANGLSWDGALAAITLNPARMFGIDDTSGSIEVGKEADLIIWGADPLELTSYPERVFIRGVAIDMFNRQTLLRDRYLDDGSGKPPAFRH